MTFDDSYLHASKRDIVDNLFTRTADENYITARWCALNRLQTDFFWLGAHALEKYMKAVLLVNGRTVKEYGHDILRLHAEISEFAGNPPRG
jgi:HEPN domain-containing protein